MDGHARLRCGLAAALAAAAAACGGTAPTTPSVPPEVLAIVVSGTTPAIGASSTFVATAQLSTGINQDVTAEAVWTSTSPGVATVVSGVVTAVSTGDTQIIAAYRQQVGVARITVRPTPPDGLNTFMRNYIESLMLGTGPLTPSEGTAGCTRFGNTWTAYAPGTVVELVVSVTVPLSGTIALGQAATTVNAASRGQVSVTVSTTSNADPRPLDQQVTVTMGSNPLAMGCTYPQGCTQLQFVPGTSVLRAARAVLQTGQTPAAFVHDAIGHGTLGLCHVDGHLIGSPGFSLMSYGTNVFSNQISAELTGFDLLATTSVYGAGLPRGAVRADFLLAGLVNPSNASVSGVRRPASDFMEIPALRIR